MGCCMSSCKVDIVEVVLDENGVARRVPEGEGTHFIRTFPDKETQIERKPPTKPSELSRPQSTNYTAKGPIVDKFNSKIESPSQFTIVEEVNDEKEHLKKVDT